MKNTVDDKKRISVAMISNAMSHHQLPFCDAMINQDLFTQLSSSWKTKSNADKSFFEKDYPQKREAFRKLALQPELEDILDMMANESIVYDDEEPESDVSNDQLDDFIDGIF